MKEKCEGAQRRAFSLAGIGLLCFMAAVPAAAAPIHYNITFTGTTTAASLPTGSFDYDPATPIFSNFTVLWDGLTFNLAGAANSPIWSNQPAAPPACTASGPALSFQLLDHDSCLSDPPNEVGARRWDILVIGSGLSFSFDGGGGGQELFFNSLPPEPYTFTDLCAATSARCGQGEWRILAVESVPEPATVALIGLGLAGLGFSRRKR